MSGRRVLYVNPTSVHGGAEEALLRIMESAQREGYEPHIVLPGPGWLDEESRKRGYPVIWLKTLPDPFVTTTPLEQVRGLPQNTASLYRIIRRLAISLVHSNTPRVAYHAGVAARLAGIPTVTHIHDIVGLPLRGFAQRRVVSALSRLFLVPSRATADRVVAMAPELGSRVRVVYNGWDRDLYEQAPEIDVRRAFGLPSDSFLIGNVAAMYPWKGQDILVRATSTLLERHPQIRLLLVGSGQGGSEQAAFEQRLHDQVEREGLGGSVIFAGWREDAWSIIRGLDVFCHVPTQPDPLPTAVIHAAALGRPILASAVGGIPEILGDGKAGLLVPPGDVASVVSGVTRMMLSDELRRELAGNAAGRFEAVFSSSSVRKGLAGAYADCLQTAT